MLLNNLILYLGKLTKQWYRTFIIDNFGGDYDTLYILITLDKELISNRYYSDYLRIFHSWKKYLYLADEKLLKVIYNLHFRKKKDWKHTLLFDSAEGSKFIRIGVIEKKKLK